MTLNLDGFELLQAIAAKREAFADVEVGVRKAATTILLTQLKFKGIDLLHARRVHDAIGTAAFALVLDTMTDKEVQSLAKKLDPYSKTLGLGESRSLRKHLLDLMRSVSEPEAKPAKLIKSAPKRSTPPPRDDLGWPTAMSAKPLGKAS
jgi:hypothetical protein